MLNALLHRIGLDGPVEPTLDGLVHVHRAYLGAIPYEDIAVQLGETGPLASAALAERFLSEGRGGYCFEVNTVFSWLLEQLGFSVERHQAVVGGEGPTNHMALVVDIDGSLWIADAGLGEGFVDPLPLEPGTHAIGPFAWTVELEPCGTWWIGAHEWSTFSGFRMDEDPSPVSAFEPHHRRLATDPESSFVKTLVVQRPRADRIDTLRARTFSSVGPGVAEKRVLDEAEFWAVLSGEFGITRRDPRLWALAVAQHDAFLAARAA
ncbi:arylamine N-acetyltransferase [Solirubrobacter sp. CPCC 204708]|uniref:Arylamine N-acetyltransferase n=1 Tax=Solirubrobacter deserti TaxID=2282478 RepID=A0ABT4RS40_9ACTN|nr:arylamine N-acetyltransferase [Solirubrobacter deserti]MBE2314798.1 arylamine N-acetyltransferase [Solirubrobacter deserti]MDA0141208.1 arylamine N-acetyltransferase [Solirubrobacter deserti]